MQVQRRTAMTLSRLAQVRPSALPPAEKQRAVIFEESRSREKPQLLDSVLLHPADGPNGAASPTMQTPPTEAAGQRRLSLAVFSLKRFGKRFGAGMPPLVRQSAAA